MNKRRLFTIFSIVLFILLIPFIVMQFTNEVSWSVSDFIIAGFLLSIVGLLLEIILAFVKIRRVRLALGVILFILFLVLWAEMAVGIFGTPIAGD
jgi:hypothetical protein